MATRLKTKDKTTGWNNGMTQQVETAGWKNRLEEQLKTTA